MYENNLFYAFIRFCLAVHFHFWHGIDCRGANHVPKQGAFLLATNHTSYFDPPLAAVASPRQLNFLAKKELFANPFFGFLITNLNAFAIRRNAGDISAIKEAIRRLRQGRGLLVFPEGTRSEDGSIQEGLPGIAYLAHKTKIPVVPAFIKSTGVPSRFHIFSKASKNLCVRFGKPLYFDPKQDISLEVMTQSIMAAVKQLAQEP